MGCTKSSLLGDTKQEGTKMPTSQNSSASEKTGAVCTEPINSYRYHCDSYYGGRCVGQKICSLTHEDRPPVKEQFGHFGELYGDTEPIAEHQAKPQQTVMLPIKDSFPLPEKKVMMGFEDYREEDLNGFLEYLDGERPEAERWLEELHKAERRLEELHIDRSHEAKDKEEFIKANLLGTKTPTNRNPEPAGRVVDGEPKGKTGTLPDSGDRREFSTGSVRDVRTGKGRFDLISPFAILSLANRLEDGMDKYGERNWEKGQNLMSYIDSAKRHINDFIIGTMVGQKSAEDHMSAALWNIQAFIHTQAMINEGLLPESLNDLPTPERVGLKREYRTTLSNPLPDPDEYKGVDGNMGHGCPHCGMVHCACDTGC